MHTKHSTQPFSLRGIQVIGLVWLLTACVDSDPQVTSSDSSSSIATIAESTLAQPTSATFDPQATFTQRCAHCHDGSVPKAPHEISFQIMGPKQIAAALNEGGVMAMHAEGLTSQQVSTLARHLGGVAASDVAVKMCDANNIPLAKPATQGWSLTTEGTRFIDTATAQLEKENVPNLSLKWAFAYPGATRARSQPVPYGDKLLIGSQDGTVYALDLDTGCAHWSYSADIEVRSALAVAEDGKSAYFADIKGNIYSIDPRNGSEHWRSKAGTHKDTTITGSPRLFESTLFIPLSSTEWSSAADPGYECCTFRGGVVAMDTTDGTVKWTTYAIPEAPTPTGETNELGVAKLHPAGAPIWNSPTIDAKRRLLYVGTGEAYTSPAADTSDSVLAIDIDSGEMVWHYQSISGDAWNMACFIGNGANCPAEDGPDLDIGAPPMLVTVKNRDLVIAGQKSGHVFALNPANGELVWRKKVGRGGFAGGIHWGMAASDDAIYAPNADTTFTGRFTGPRKPGLFALNPGDGEIMWFTPAPDICTSESKPACDPGLSAAVTAIDGVVFAGAFDGHVRAYDAENGAVLWDFDTNQNFTSVSGEVARGGSIEADGPVIYQGHVLVNSGYLFGSRMPGNVLLAFTANDD